MEMTMAWIHMPTGASAALDESPLDNLYNFAGFASADAVIWTLAKRMPEREAEDLVELTFRVHSLLVFARAG